MPPPPVDGDVGLPAILHKLLDYLRLLLVSFCNVFVYLWLSISTACVAIWFCVVQAFEAVWTWSPFEALRTGLVAVVSYLFTHLVTIAKIVFFVFIVIPCVCNILELALRHCLELRREGMLCDSDTTNYQTIATSHGGNVEQEPPFGRLQSQGTKGSGASSSRLN